MQITIQVKNAQLVGKGLANIRAEIPKISERTIKTAGEKIIRQMQNYPPERTNQKYVRTYKFKSGWRLDRSATGYTVKNPTSYGRYVVGDFAGSGQAWMHVGRWLLLRDVTEYEVTQLPPMVEEHIRLKVRQERLA
jgi:hypothetical protein